MPGISSMLRAARLFTTTKPVETVHLTSSLCAERWWSPDTSCRPGEPKNCCQAAGAGASDAQNTEAAVREQKMTGQLSAAQKAGCQGGKNWAPSSLTPGTRLHILGLGAEKGGT